jgi:hypothetical protein
MALCHAIFPCLLLIISLLSTTAQEEELCPDFTEIDPLKECQTVVDYEALRTLVEASPTGTQLNLCPFFLSKVETVAPALVRSGIQVRCIRKTVNDFCIVAGQVLISRSRAREFSTTISMLYTPILKRHILPCRITS